MFLRIAIKFYFLKYGRNRSFSVGPESHVIRDIVDINRNMMEIIS